MFHVEQKPIESHHERLLEAKRWLEWDDDDPRWESLKHFLNRVQNAGLALVSRRDRNRLLERHLLPCLEATSFIPHCGRLLDIGSGGGFPAIPIAFARPCLTITAVESNERKAAFLKRVSRETSLSNVSILCSRVEKLYPSMNSLFDVITARAVAQIPQIVKWTYALLSSSGSFLFWQSRRNLKHLEEVSPLFESRHERTLSDGSILIVLSHKKG